MPPTKAKRRKATPSAADLQPISYLPPGLGTASDITFPGVISGIADYARGLLRQDVEQRRRAAESLDAGVAAYGVTPQMILNRQFAAMGGSGPYGLPSGVEPAVADYRRVHQPALLPVPEVEEPAPAVSPFGALAGLLGGAAATATPVPQSYNLPAATEMYRSALGGSPGDVDAAYQDRLARDLARQRFAQRLRQAAGLAQTQPEGALPVYPGPMIGAAPGTVLSQATPRPTSEKWTAHHEAQQQQTLPQFYLRSKRMNLPPAPLAYTEAVARGEKPPEHVMAGVFPNYPEMRMADAAYRHTLPEFQEGEIRKAMATGLGTALAESAMQRFGTQESIGPAATEALVNRILEPLLPNDRQGQAPQLLPPATPERILGHHVAEAMQVHPGDEDAQLDYLTANFGYPSEEAKAALRRAQGLLDRQRKERAQRAISKHPLVEMKNTAITHFDKLLRGLTGNL